MVVSWSSTCFSGLINQVTDAILECPKHRPSSAATGSTLTPQVSQGTLNLAAIAAANKDIATLKHTDSRDKLLLVARNNSIGEENGGNKGVPTHSPLINKNSGGSLAGQTPTINVVSSSSPRM